MLVFCFRTSLPFDTKSRLCFGKHQREIMLRQHKIELICYMLKICNINIIESKIMKVAMGYSRKSLYIRDDNMVCPGVKKALSVVKTVHLSV